MLSSLKISEAINLPLEMVWGFVSNMDNAPLWVYNLEEMKLTLSYDLSNGWTASGTQVWDLSNGRRKRDSATATLQWTGGIQNCLTVNFDYDRDLESDRDIKASNKFLITVNFKYLGAITQRDFANDN